MTLRLSAALVGFLALLLPAAPASAQPNGDGFARQCIEEIQATTGATVHAVRGATVRGARAIIHLDRNGATDDEMIQAARRAVGAMHEAAMRGATRVNHVTARCVNALRDHGAPDRVIMAVLRARAECLHAIRHSVAYGEHVIAHVLHRALNN